METGLIFQDGRLIFLDHFLIGSDLALVGKDRFLVLQDLLLIADHSLFRHGVVPGLRALKWTCKLLRRRFPRSERLHVVLCANVRQ